MNISNQIQIIYVPWWVKALVIGLMTTSIAVCLYLFYSALNDNSKDDWMSAGAYLLGIVFPILIAGIVLGGASFGEKSITKRTQRILIETLPYHLQFIPEESRFFKSYGDRRLWWHKSITSPKTSDAELAKVRVFHSEGRCYADYQLEIPDQKKSETPDQKEPKLHLDLRVELNIKRANVNLVFCKHQIKELIGKHPTKNLTDMQFFQEKFPHTLEVERKQAAEQTIKSSSGASTISYEFSQNLLTRHIDKRDYLVLVATTPLAEDTVWNPSEAVIFAQDLMFMIRAFLQENAEMFRREQ